MFMYWSTRSVTYCSCTAQNDKQSGAGIDCLLLDNLGQVPHVDLNDCYFQQGQTAVALQGQSEVRAVNCAFGPHDHCFTCANKPGQDRQGDEQGDTRSLHRVRRSGPGVSARRQSRLRLAINFSRSSRAPIPAAALDNRLILQTQASANPIVKYKGARDRHDLNGLWSWPGKTAITDIHGVPGCEDKDSLVLPATPSPWADPEPLQRLNLPMQAFQVVDNWPTSAIDGGVAAGPVKITYCSVFCSLISWAEFATIACLDLKRCPRSAAILVRPRSPRGRTPTPLPNLAPAGRILLPQRHQN